MNAMPSPAGSPGTSFLARAALALYPAAWRARYGDEVRALLDDSGAGPRAIASLAWRALPAWIWPPRHLYGRQARMRASLATVLVAWTALTGLALVFAQLTQAQGLGRPAIRSCSGRTGSSTGPFSSPCSLSPRAACRCGC